MRLLLIVACFCLLESHCKSVKKTPKDEIVTKGINSKVPIKKSAIVAIEIVDSDEEPEPVPTKSKGKVKNGKRTIETSLGYGYQNSFGHSKPKFQIYKYSQDDIPSYKGSSSHHKPIYPSAALSHHQNENFHVQKSIEYSLGTQTYVEPQKQLFQPQAGYHQTVPQQQQQQQHNPVTLYTTLDQTGHLGELSQEVPYESGPSALVPVIILRVYTNQLSNPSAFYPNLPQTHPYSHLNNVNLQSLLGGYLHQNDGYQQQHQTYMHTPQYDTRYVQGEDLDTHENYPSNKHTKVIFHKNVGTPKAPAPVVLRQQYQTNEQEQGYYYPAPAKQVVYEPQQQAYYQDESGQMYQYYTSHDEAAGQYQAETQASYDEAPVEYQSTSQAEQHAQIYVTPEPEYSTKTPFNYHAHPTGRRNVQVIHQDAGSTKAYRKRTVSTRAPKTKRTKKTVEKDTAIAGEP